MFLFFLFVFLFFFNLRETSRNRLTEKVLTSTHNLCFEQKYEKYQSFLSENFQFLQVKFSIYLNRRVFVMKNPRDLKMSSNHPWYESAVFELLRFYCIWNSKPLSNYIPSKYLKDGSYDAFCLLNSFSGLLSYPNNKQSLSTYFFSFSRTAIGTDR